MTVSTGQDGMTAANLIREIDAASRESLAPDRLRTAKKAYTTRPVAARIAAEAHGYMLLNGPRVTPLPGDVVLARVEALGMHTRLESPESRRQALFVGDEILVAYGNRYAPDQFEAEVPSDLRPVHLVAAGGVAALVSAKHRQVADATAVRPLGLLADAHGVVSLRRLAPRQLSTEFPEATTGRIPHGRPKVIGVLGTSMNSGKSTTVNSLIRGLVRAGLRVSAGKATGTGAGGDPHGFADAGATKVLDFTDFGFPSTFRLEPDEVRAILLSLVEHLSEPGVDVLVVEIADGLYQDETSRLLADPWFAQVVDHVVFAADGAAGAAAGVRLLHECGVRISAVSGVLTSAPLASREARSVLDVPVIETFSLTDPDVARTVL